MSKRIYGARAAERKARTYTSSTSAFQVSEDIMPIAELKSRMSAVVRSLETRPRPLVITLNGMPAAVLMSPREFDRLTYEKRFVTAVDEGLTDVEAGHLHDAEDVFDELEARLDSRIGAVGRAAKPSKR